METNNNEEQGVDQHHKYLNYNFEVPELQLDDYHQQVLLNEEQMSSNYSLTSDEKDDAIVDGKEILRVKQKGDSWSSCC